MVGDTGGNCPAPADCLLAGIAAVLRHGTVDAGRIIVGDSFCLVYAGAGWVEEISAAEEGEMGDKVWRMVKSIELLRGVERQSSNFMRCCNHVLISQ